MLDYFCARSKDNKASSSMYIHTHSCAAGWLSARRTQPLIVNKRTRQDRQRGGGGNHPLLLGVITAVSGWASVFVSNRLQRFVAAPRDGRTPPPEATAVLGVSGGPRPCVAHTVTRFTTVAALFLLLLLTSGAGGGESVDDEAVGKLFAEKGEQFGRRAGAVGQLELL